jgi:hypothetical protein
LNQPPVHKSYRYLYLLVAAAIFVYIVLRAIYVTALMDEVSTFFTYVRPGRMQPGYSYLDANNHLLNSLLSHICYQLFGDGIFVIRIPNLIGFVIYAYYGYKIYDNMENPFAKISWIALIFGAEYFIEFFSICRGYGLSFGFLMAVFYYLIQQFTTRSTKGFIGVVVCNILMIFSNLALLSWSPLFFLASVALVLIKPKNYKEYIVILITTILYIWAFLYLYQYVTLLQKNGKIYLWAGNTFYEVIYKGLCIELGLGSFTLGELIIIPLLVLLPPIFLLNFKRMGMKEFFLVICFVGFCVGFIFLHLLLKVNYPPDRSSIQIYLVLALAYVMNLNKNKIKLVNYITLIPVIFVVYFFISNLNTTHTSHWKTEAIPQSFVKEIARLNESQQVPYSVGLHMLDVNGWDYQNYLNKYSINFGKGYYSCDSLSDILVVSGTRKNVIIPSGYDTIAIYPLTGYLLLKKKNIEHIYKEIRMPDINSADEFIGLYHISPDSCKKRSFKMGLEFVVVESNIIEEAFLVFTTKKEYNRFDMRRMKKNKKIKIAVSLSLHPRDEDIIAYIWNMDKKRFIIKDIKVYMEKID